MEVVVAMSPDEARVVNMIREAFHGVMLGNGVGLRQGCGLDDYADFQTLTELRSKDEKHDWSKISLKDLKGYRDSLSFFDAEGMRFHLPAFLIASLQGAGPDVLFHLARAADQCAPKFELLNTAQRRAVREFLLLKLQQLSEPKRGFEAPIIETALNKHWTTQD